MTGHFVGVAKLLHCEKHPVQMMVEFSGSVVIILFVPTTLELHTGLTVQMIFLVGDGARICACMSVSLCVCERECVCVC